MFSKLFNRSDNESGVNKLTKPLDPPPTVPQSKDLEGKVLGRYQLIRKVGQGNMGTVYLGYDSKAEREVAIKVIDPDKLNDPVHGRLYNQMFFNEGQMAGVLQHPNIIEILDARTDNDLSYIVMEYIPNAITAEEYCSVDNRLSVRDIVTVVSECAAALDFAHKHGVIHRDIKPHNILLTADNDVKIGDFGIVLLPGQTQMSHVGSPLYMSPEQINGHELTQQSDLFSLGVVLYQMITGKHPFAAVNFSAIRHRIVNTVPAALRNHRWDLPEVLEMVVERALAKEPKHRYKTGMDLFGDLSLVYDFLDAQEQEIDDKEKFEAAREIAFFNEFSDAELWELIGTCAWQRVPQGKEIILEDEVDKSFYIIISGSVVVSKGDNLLDLLKPGDCFGEIGLLSTASRRATMRAGEDVTVMKAHAPIIARTSLNCQLRFYKRFLNTLIERLSKNTPKRKGDAVSKVA